MVMLRLFAAMNENWGCKWTSHLSDDKKVDRALLSWTKSFSDLTDKQIFDAFEVLKNSEEWPPCIAKFRKTALKLQGVDEAFELAINHDDKYRKFLRSWDWQHLSETDCKRKFCAKYKQYELELLNRCSEFEIGCDDRLIAKQTNALEYTHDMQ
jgi:hypothetical protein